ncbi:hypothetical protein SAY87_024363 [Trapa incisa]|uniref:Uncharacterized protein n=1 Tax=Trapa incisa TaxID=236973 RepID=A0AAN7GE96_9MYRT|nr:hypothetical protein SAY87_024363 [Trapa incisa]
MMPCFFSLGDRILPRLRDYDRLQSLAIVLIYVQISCALVESLGVLYNGVLLINLASALFALLAIQSSNQSMGRTYVVLLICVILLVIAWFILFSCEIWCVSAQECVVARSMAKLKAGNVLHSISQNGSILIAEVKYSLKGQSEMKGRFQSVFGEFKHDADFDLRNSFLSPAIPAIRETPDPDDAVRGSIYNPADYSSLFDDGLGNGFSKRIENQSFPE